MVYSAKWYLHGIPCKVVFAWYTISRMVYAKWYLLKSIRYHADYMVYQIGNFSLKSIRYHPDMWYTTQSGICMVYPVEWYLHGIPCRVVFAWYTMQSGICMVYYIAHGIPYKYYILYTCVGYHIYVGYTIIYHVEYYITWYESISVLPTRLEPTRCLSDRLRSY